MSVDSKKWNLGELAILQLVVLIFTIVFLQEIIDYSIFLGLTVAIVVVVIHSILLHKTSKEMDRVFVKKEGEKDA